MNADRSAPPKSFAAPFPDSEANGYAGWCAPPPAAGVLEDPGPSVGHDTPPLAADEVAVLEDESMGGGGGGGGGGEAATCLESATEVVSVLVPCEWWSP